MINAQYWRPYLQPKKILVGLGILLGIIIVLRTFFANYYRDDIENKEEAVTVEVKTFRAQPRTKTLMLRGHTEAYRKITLKAETAGSIVFIIMDKGIPIKKGDVIARIGKEDRPQKLAEAEALLKQREQEYRAAQKLVSQSFRSETELAQKNAALKSAEANLANIRTDLERTEIQAPFGGVLEKRHVEIGDYLKVGDMVVDIVELSPMKVAADASEQEVAGLNVGTPGWVKLPDGSKIEGQIVYVSSSAKSETRTFTVELQIPNPEFLIRNGLTAEVYIPVKSVKAHIISPAILSLNDKGVLGVKSINGENIVHFNPVTILAQESKGVWITGLPETIRLIVNGQDFFSPGQKVKVNEK